MNHVVVLLAAIALIAPIAGAQTDLLLPGPSERTMRDCDVCPLMVILPDGLLMSQGPTTRGEFAMFVEAMQFEQPNWGCKWHAAAIEQTDAHPVVCVSYNDALAYADWLGAQSGKEYRLPTLEEMRGAMLAGASSNYWWGQSVGEARANCVGCGSEKEGHGTVPVGSYEKNPFHIVDAVGNVWIWTDDCVDETCEAHKLVGGGWSNPPADLRMTKTIWNLNEIPFNTYGIRVVREGE